MSGAVTPTSEPIDHRTNRSIRDAVGELLQRDLGPQSFAPSSYLEHLLEELRKQEERRP